MPTTFRPIVLDNIGADGQVVDHTLFVTQDKALEGLSREDLLQIGLAVLKFLERPTEK